MSLFAPRRASLEVPDPDAYGHVWRQAAIGTGLIQIVGTVTGPTEVIPKIERVERGSLLVRMLAGQIYDDYLAVANRLGPALGVAMVRVEPAGLQHVRLDLLLEDPLTATIPLPATQGSPSGVLLGRDDAGRAIRLDWRGGAHTAIQGVTRSGKSVLCYGVLAQLAAIPEVLIAGIDPTALLLRVFADTRHAKYQALGLADHNAHEQVLEDLVAVMDRRIAELPIDRDTIEIGINQPALVVVLEEYPGELRAIDAIDKDRGKRIRAMVGRLLAEGAKVGVRVIMLAQRAEAAVIGSFERAMCSTRISFRCDSRGSVELLHPGADPAIADAHTRALPGVGLITSPGHELRRFKAVYLGAYREYAQAVRRAD